MPAASSAVHDAHVGRVVWRQSLQRREEDAVDASRNVLLRACPGHSRAADARRVPAAPQEHMRPGIRGRQEALHERFENLDVGQVGDQHAKRALGDSGRRRWPHVRAGPDAPFDEALQLKVADGSAHGDPRGAKTGDQVPLRSAPAHPPSGAPTRCPCGARRRRPGTWAPRVRNVACARCYDNLATIGKRCEAFAFRQCTAQL